ncbi:MAG: hypothetical protein ABS938_20040 [Psychrobacillus psychrodurans]
MALLNPTLFAEWIEPHSFEWYNQLGETARRICIFMEFYYIKT